MSLAYHRRKVHALVTSGIGPFPSMAFIWCKFLGVRNSEWQLRHAELDYAENLCCQISR